MANKILIPLLSLVSCFLNPPMNRQAAVGATEGLWQGLLLSVSQRLHSLLGPVAVTKEGGDSSVLNLFCAKDQANENCEHRSGIWQIFRQFMKWIPQHIFSTDFFLPSFNSSLRRCHCLQSIGQVITFPFLKVVLETVYLRLRLKPTWQGLCAMLSHSLYPTGT